MLSPPLLNLYIFSDNQPEAILYTLDTLTLITGLIYMIRALQRQH